MLQQYNWMMATKTWTSTLVCWRRQSTARGGCNVQQKTSQKFDEMCDSKISKSRWPTWQVLEIEKDDGKQCKDTPHPAREKTHRHRSIPEIAVLCHLPRKTSQLPAEPEEWPKRWRNSEVCIFCMCHLVGLRPRLADTAAWCFFSLLYHICGFCRCLAMFYPLFHPV